MGDKEQKELNMDEDLLREIKPKNLKTLMKKLSNEGRQRDRRKVERILEEKTG